MRRTLLPAAAIFCFLSQPIKAQTCYPMVNRIEPTAVQRGKTAEISIYGGGASGGGANFSGAFALLTQPPGLTGSIVSAEMIVPTPGKTKGRGNRRGSGVVKAKLVVATDAPLGPREVRVATPQGVSSVGLVVVVNNPVVPEASDKANDESKGAEELKLPCAVAGSIGKLEDVDWYMFEAKAGDRVAFSVLANRLENKIHDLQTHFDPILTLHDASGRELAADDNHDLADPLLVHEIKETGRYYLQIRDTTYGGNAHWTYVLQATSGPVATSVFPLAVNPGKKAALHAKGSNIDSAEIITLEVPTGLADGPELFSLQTTKGLTLATSLVVTSLPVTLEKDDTLEAAEKAQLVTLPTSITGRLGAANDVDSYRFEAKKGITYAFEVVARRAGAAIDPTLKVVNLKGAALSEVDDSPGLGKDVRIEWTAPSDGPFALQISDLHSRGGDDFGYVINAAPAPPDFTLTCDPDKLNVGPGGRVPLFVRVNRRAGFDGPVTIDLAPLPPGASASPLTIGPKMKEGVIVISGAKDAKPAATLTALRGKADTKAGPIVREVSASQEIYLPGGGRGIYPVETLAVGVTDPSDITLDAAPATISLKPGGTAEIEVTVTRKPGFELPVNLAVLLQHLGGTHANPLPPGVKVREAGSKTLVGPKENKGKIILEAQADAAAIHDVPICVMGHVSINFVVKTAYATAPIALDVVK